MRRLRRWLIHRFTNDWPRRRVCRIIQDATRDRICRGLFSGMKYVEESIGSAYYPKLLGTYEKELIPWFERLMRQPFRQFIDLGAAEGYYAVGMALSTGWQTVAYEANPQTPLPELARLNGVSDLVTLRGACDLGELQDALNAEPDSLLLVDVETAELTLLDPRYIPELKSVTMVVEVHDCFLPGIGERLRTRFDRTHHIEELKALPREFTDCSIELPSLPFNPELYVLEYLNEQRPEGMYWMLFTPRT